MNIGSTLPRRTTMPREIYPEKKLVQTLLPWLVAAAAFVLYLVTLNPWVTFNSLSVVARTSGWTWQPELSGPLYWLVTYPFRWLPSSTIPQTLNLFSAICAALTLALLARSVALLPHDRTEEQRLREKGAYSLLSVPLAWLPPVLAVALCGLQLTFWENATIASGDMLDLLVFAYVIRCVLEYRLDGRDSWLLRAALVYGLGMTNNWAMVAFFPLFLVALVWIKGVSFFDGRFLGRMFVFGVAGLSLYLLLPLVSSLTSSVSFWQALKTNLATQKFFAKSLPFNKGLLLHGLDALHHDGPLWVLGLPTLLPLLLLGIRWPSYFGDPSKLGLALTTSIFHFVHAALLVVCAWFALDTQFSPRHLLPMLPMLTFYYLGALCAGYYSGYLLLVFRRITPAVRPGRPTPVYVPLLSTASMGAVLLLAVASITLLLSRNVPQIRATNGPLLRQYADLAAEALPSQGAVVLSDAVSELLLLQSDLTQAGHSKEYVFVHTGSLSSPDYHRFLNRQHPRVWRDSPPKELKEVQDFDKLRIIYQLSQSNKVCYLHPSFGYYFEVLYPEPHGLVYQLRSFPANTLLAPEAGSDLIAENEKFWARADDLALKRLLKIIDPITLHRDQGLWDQLAERVHLTKEPNRDASGLAMLYSRALNFWGVQLQRQGQLAAAATHFERAVGLNPDNVPAKINLACNANLQAGRKTSIEISSSINDQLGKYRDWQQVMRDNGPFDEPSFCFLQGQAFRQSGNPRQAAQQFARVVALAPEDLMSRLLLANLYTLTRMPDEALKVLHAIHDQPDLLKLGPTNETALLTVEAAAYYSKGDLTNGDTVIQGFLNKYPGNTNFLTTAVQVYMDFQRYSNALTAIEQHLKLSPDDPSVLVNKGLAYLRLNAYDVAIPPLTRVVAMETNNFSEIHYAALFDRAIAYLQSDKLAESQRDYEDLQKAFPTDHRLYFGLGEIAERKNDNAAAIRNFQLYLANAPTNTAEASNVLARLTKLNRGSR